METRVPARLIAAAGRKFGLTVGLAFVAIGGILLWRQHPTKAYVSLSLGALLVVAGLVIPTLLGPVERAWMGLAHLISKVTTPIFMGIVYFIAITPIGYVRSRNGSPLRRPRGQSSWLPRTDRDKEPAAMERQF